MQAAMNVLTLLAAIGATAFVFIQLLNHEIAVINAAVEAAKEKGVENPVIGPPGVHIENPALFIALIALTLIFGLVVWVAAATVEAMGAPAKVGKPPRGRGGRAARGGWRAVSGALVGEVLGEALRGVHIRLKGSPPHRLLKLAKEALCGTTIPPRLAALELRKRARRARTVGALVGLAFGFYFPPFALTVKPVQVREEVAALLEILRSLRPRACLEIGTARGGTLFLFAQVASPDAVLISVDLPGGPFGGGYPAWKIPLYKSFARYETQKIYLLRRDSHDPKTLEMVRKILGNGKLDFLFIDGDHSYEGVKRDFEMYSPLVRKGGIIAFHDIVPGPSENVGGIPEFWNYMKNRHRHLEIVKNWNQGGYGIGVIFV